MLVIGILQLLGILALSFLLTPFVLSLIAIIFAVFVLTATILARLTIQHSLKAFPKVFRRFARMKHDIDKEHRTGNHEIPSPNHLHSMRVRIEKGRYLQPICNLKSRDSCEDQSDELRLYRPKQPLIYLLSDKFNGVLKGIHRLPLFYKSYYGHSTKVEKNPTGSSAIPCISARATHIIHTIRQAGNSSEQPPKLSPSHPVKSADHQA